MDAFLKKMPPLRAPTVLDSEPIVMLDSPTYEQFDVRSAILDLLLRNAPENVEFEYRAKVPRAQFERMQRKMNATNMPRTTSETVTRSGDGDIRSIDGEFFTKRQIHSDIAGSGKKVLSIEMRADETNTRLPIVRRKKRTRYEYRCWFIDLTHVESNEPRYRDEVDGLFEVELELNLHSEFLFYYTMEHVVSWAESLFDEIITI